MRLPEHRHGEDCGCYFQPQQPPCHGHHPPAPRPSGSAGKWIGGALVACVLLLTVAVSAVAVAVAAVSVALCALVIRWIIADIRRNR
ncbi:hypothetical protein [Streptomyces albicerus]|uniref:hypothetical protein n=1 Tax=Streptomyces albicerus TaxID=2569859 RepID=UPI00124B0B5D|nr:hypothetical protein [Streptomyces albicerus]